MRLVLPHATKSVATDLHFRHPVPGVLKHTLSFFYRYIRCQLYLLLCDLLVFDAEHTCLFCVAMPIHIVYQVVNRVYQTAGNVYTRPLLCAIELLNWISSVCYACVAAVTRGILHCLTLTGNVEA